MAQLVMPSGEMRMVPENCRATIGQVGNVDALLVSLGKAGRSRHRGIRPHVRGSAMNPYSHPLGGGEGRSGADVRRARRGASSPRAARRASARSRATGSSSGAAPS